MRLGIALRAWGFVLLGSLPLLAALATMRASAESAPRQGGSGERYFIEFRARPSTYIGHTYIIYGRIDVAGRAIDYTYAGLIPEYNVWQGFFGLVPATVRHYKDDSLFKPNTIYRRSITAAEFDSVVRTVRFLRSIEHEWHPIFQNCNDFAIEVAEALGMRRPPSLMPPSMWVAMLRLMNEQ